MEEKCEAELINKFAGEKVANYANMSNSKAIKKLKEVEPAWIMANAQSIVQPEAPTRGLVSADLKTGCQKGGEISCGTYLR